jgi:hypothetical protein
LFLFPQAIRFADRQLGRENACRNAEVEHGMVGCDTQRFAASHIERDRVVIFGMDPEPLQKLTGGKFWR